MNLNKYDLCPCGSGKNAKFCYLKKGSACKLLKKENLKIYYEYILKHCSSILYYLVEQNFKNKTLDFRSQILLAFTYADCMARITEVFFCKEIYTKMGDETRSKYEKNNKVGRLWVYLDHYFCTDKNDAFNRYRNKEDLDSKKLYMLRNSLMHFYSVPHANEHSIILASNEADLAAFEKNLPQTPKLTPDIFHDIVLDSLKIFCEDLISPSPMDNYDKIKKVHDFLNEEASVLVYQNDNKELVDSFDKLNIKVSI